MSDSANVPELQDLEPLDAGAPVADDGGAAMPTAEDASLSALRSGLPPIAFNPRCADKTFYKFLFAGVVMLLGCLMPFGPQTDLVGYKTMSGGLFTIIALGMIWTWWAAIHFNRSTAASLKWLALCFVPLIVQLMNLIGAFDAPAVAAAIRDGVAISKSWNDLFADIGSALAKDADAGMRVENFFRYFGPGKFFVFVGALLAEMSFFGGIVGGAKKNKQDKVARQMASAERKRR
ncbi:MAG: hypothetical protein IPK26_14200 [Planctomycetes bacterium]|nr:hypothetical protein [Planctomycetota bacterium]